MTKRMKLFLCDFCYNGEQGNEYFFDGGKFLLITASNYLKPCIAVHEYDVSYAFKANLELDERLFCLN